VARARGDRVRARQALDEVAEHGRAPLVMLALGRLAADADEESAAQSLMEEALADAQAIGREAIAAACLHSLGLLAGRRGDPAGASALQVEALHVQRQIGDLPSIASTLEAIGGLSATAGHPEDAARILGASEALRRTGGYARHPWETDAYEAGL